eukprot:3364602-Rhodomonas_salina.2
MEADPGLQRPIRDLVPGSQWDGGLRRVRDRLSQYRRSRYCGRAAERRACRRMQAGRETLEHSTLRYLRRAECRMMP